MEVNVKKVKAKIIDIAIERGVYVKSINQSRDVNKKFAIIINKCLIADFIFLIGKEFNDDGVIVYAEENNVGVIFDVNNFDYWI